MADADARQALLVSRSVRLTLIMCAPVAFAVVLAEIAIFILILRRDIGPEIGIGLMFGGILTPAFTIVPMVKSVVESWTKQDVAKTEAAGAVAVAATPASTALVVPAASVPAAMVLAAGGT